MPSCAERRYFGWDWFKWWQGSSVVLWVTMFGSRVVVVVTLRTTCIIQSCVTHMWSYLFTVSSSTVTSFCWHQNIKPNFCFTHVKPLLPTSLKSNTSKYIWLFCLTDGFWNNRGTLSPAVLVPETTPVCTRCGSGRSCPTTYSPPYVRPASRPTLLLHPYTVSVLLWFFNKLNYLLLADIDLIRPPTPK